MYHKFRIIVVSLVVVMMCVLSSTGTLSYFMDSDGATNSFTIGNASTVLAVYGDVAGENKQLFNTESLSPIEDGSDVAYYLQATNDGNIPVYQRFRVVLPKALDGVVTLNLPTMNEGCVVETVAGHTCENADYTVIYDDSVIVDSTTEYAEYYIISKNPLAVNGMTREWPMLGIHFGDITGVQNYESLLECSDGSGNNCALGIKAYSDVIQTTGFTNAVNAFANFTETYN